MALKKDAPYPYLGINGGYLATDFLKGVEADLVSKIPIWQAGILEPTPCERLAYLILKQIKMDAWTKV